MADIIQFGRKKTAEPEPEPEKRPRKSAKKKTGPTAEIHTFAPAPKPRIVAPMPDVGRYDSDTPGSFLDTILDIVDKEGAGDPFISRDAVIRLKRKQEMQQAINSLQGRSSNFDNNVAIRTRIVKDLADEALLQEFNESVGNDWTARPAYYTAIINEVDRRGFFMIMKNLKDINADKQDDE
ncbi:MAG: hypothetical protein NUV56_01735 [Candidatus Uhrbacteria bacterium]|nr:hypothetical protein [Candidatus Uhrbacteria bacterium]